MVDGWAELEHSGDRSYFQREVALAIRLRQEVKAGGASC